MDRLLDCLVLNDGTELHGIVDYITTKHAYFFDFTHAENKNYILLAAIWRGTTNAGEVRFSVYSTIEFPTIPLPRAVLIPKSNIQSASCDLSPTKKAKQTKIKAQGTF